MCGPDRCSYLQTCKHPHGTSAKLKARNQQQSMSLIPAKNFNRQGNLSTPPSRLITLTMSTNQSDIIDLPHAGTIQAHSPNYLIFFITGNPGLIEYYRVFLSRLYSSLSSSSSLRNARIRVFGRSLSGFDVSGSQDGAAARGRASGAPYGLQEQIDGVERALWEVVAQEGGDVPRVVLVGHSVGAYILLEIVRRCRGGLRGDGGQEVGAEGKTRIVGGVCLFPTVTHIARSRSGRKFSVRGSSVVAVPSPPLLLLLSVVVVAAIVTIKYASIDHLQTSPPAIRCSSPR